MLSSNKNDQNALKIISKREVLAGNLILPLPRAARRYSPIVEILSKYYFFPSCWLFHLKPIQVNINMQKKKPHKKLLPCGPVSAKGYIRVLLIIMWTTLGSQKHNFLSLSLPPTTPHFRLFASHVQKETGHRKQLLPPLWKMEQELVNILVVTSDGSLVVLSDLMKHRCFLSWIDRSRKAKINQSSKQTKNQEIISSILSQILGKKIQWHNFPKFKLLTFFWSLVFAIVTGQGGQWETQWRKNLQMNVNGMKLITPILAIGFPCGFVFYTFMEREREESREKVRERYLACKHNSNLHRCVPNRKF